MEEVTQGDQWEWRMCWPVRSR